MVGPDRVGGTFAGDTHSVGFGFGVFFPFSHIAYVMPEVHPLALVARPPIPAEPKGPQHNHPDKSPKAEHRKRYPTPHRKGKK